MLGCTCTIHLGIQWPRIRVQRAYATQLEASKVKHGMENVYKKPANFENKSKGKEEHKNI